MKRVLLLSAYDAKSHQYWRKGLEENVTGIDWTVLTLPARYFSWRIRGNSLSWAYSERDTLVKPYDLIIATSVVDVATLKGIVPQLASVPTIVYFHENQFAYPTSKQQHHSLEPQMVNLYSALAATQVVFNSHYNRSTFLAGVSSLLKRLPEKLPREIVAQLTEQSSVIPVPIVPLVCASTQKSKVFTLLWNHRWEYDKGPDRLLLLLRHLKRNGVEFSLHILGESFRQCPESFSIIEHEFKSNLVSFGYVESKDDYLKLLGQCDVVLSTSLHDFQGLSVLEAVAAGCVPVLPNRLAYPDYFEQEYLYDSYLDDPEKESQAMAGQMLVLYQQWLAGEALPVPSIERLFWPSCKKDYERLMNDVMSSKVP
ncbi:glycosyl transferase family 1 [Gammaproteobacteria bacterium 45_16_T64]|nr:glycosyl transferase family 1 [Gammaproteobacteria bacterium 45_16_T64]